MFVKRKVTSRTRLFSRPSDRTDESVRNPVVFQPVVGCIPDGIRLQSSRYTIVFQTVYDCSPVGIQLYSSRYAIAFQSVYAWILA